jgi:hypothetical protein
MKTLKWRLKTCPRCHGDIYLDRDHNGWFEKCLQCSYSRELTDISEFNIDKRAVASYK